MLTLINGLATEAVSASDRGLLYGDGVFRTLLRRDGVARNWTRHYRKLAHDCVALRLECPGTAVLEADMAQLPPDCVAKIIITRGPGVRGYAVTAGALPTRIVAASPLPAWPMEWRSEGVRVQVCRLRLASQPALAGIKHLNRLENVLARMEWNDPGIAEGLLLDQAGNVIEGTMSNVLARRGKTLHTPDLAACGVAGVQRERILACAAELGLAVQVGALSLDGLKEAEEVMLCNSVIGVWQVRELDGRTWPAGSLTEPLRQRLETGDD